MERSSLLLVVALSLTGCVGDVGQYYDDDEDGFYPPEAASEGFEPPFDCNEGDPDINPGADEVCDGVDNNCDDLIDDGADRVLAYVDGDGDGFGNDELSELRCAIDEGWADRGEDCDDGDAGIHPDADELCDAEDRDCDGDPTLGAIDPDAWYLDADGDDFGDVSEEVIACDAPEGYVASPDDCDDTEAAVNPAAQEVCSGIDEDCDDLVDQADPTMNGLATWYADADEDGYGDLAVTQQSCTQPSGYVRYATDCDDGAAAVNPGATEACNGFDDDCDEAVDDDDDAPTGTSTWYRDGDSDTHGSSTSTVAACAAPDGYVASSDDCNDTNGAIRPGATEVCDSVDNDCDKAVDDADSGRVGGTTWYRDVDGDTYGTTTTTTVACAAPTGYVASSADCNDSAAAIKPGATEVCDSVDNDCDKAVDDADSGRVGGTTWYRDADADGHGTPTTAQDACQQPQGYVASFDDCNDNAGAIKPGATEVCDDLDNDCDDDIDDADSGRVGGSTWYVDADGDTYGASTTSKLACDRPSGYADDKLDCDDGDKLVHPGATEVCNDFADNDCDGTPNQCMLSGEISLADADVKIIGETANDWFGYSLASTDLDGDGDDDLVVGAPASDGVNGAHYVIRGKSSWSDLVDASAADSRLNTSSTGSYGYSVALCDFWSAGVSQAVVGKYVPAGTSSVGVRASSGNPPRLEGTVTSSRTGDGFGRAVVCGDFDDDGATDLVVGAPYDDLTSTDGGRVYIVFGPGNAYGLNSFDVRAAQIGARQLTTATAQAKAGDSLARGDVDGDGADDLLIGAPGANRAYLMMTSTSSASDLSTANAVLTGGSTTGSSVAAGDLDGDGYDDVIVGAPSDSSAMTYAGMVYVERGSSTAATWGTVSLSVAADSRRYGAASYDSVGSHVAVILDADSTGSAALAIGAAGAGKAYVEVGPLANGGARIADTASFVFASEQTGDSVTSAMVAGDLNGDGYGDVVVGARGESQGGDDAGAAYVIFGLGL